MKTLLSIFSLIIFISLYSCKKDNTPAWSPAPVPSIVGTWHVVSDTSYSQGIGVNKLTVYTGTGLDHYNFTSSGMFDLHEGDAVGSGTYSLKDSILTLNGPNRSGARSYQVVLLTNHSAVIAAGVASPGGASGNIITLER